MAKRYPWFRVYHEIISDKKLRHIAMTTGQYFETILGTWITLLCLANDSPIRGMLLLADDMPVTDEEIQATISLPPDILNHIMELFVKLNMLVKSGGCYEIVNWGDRQFDSDNSSARVKKYRDRRRAAGLPVAPTYKTKDVLAIFDNACVYCGATSSLCVDHAVPIQLGGTDDTLNLVAACKACNSGKAGRTPEGAGYSFINPLAQERYSQYVTVTGRDRTREEDKNYKETEEDVDQIHIQRERLQETVTERDRNNKKTPTLPVHLATRDMMNAWGEWQAYHCDKGRELTKVTALKQFKLIEQMGIERAIAAIDHSIAHNYTGLIEPKPSPNGQHPQTDEDGLTPIQRKVQIAQEKMKDGKLGK
jgi:hypothetical protein